MVQLGRSLFELFNLKFDSITRIWESLTHFLHTPADMVSNLAFFNQFVDRRTIGHMLGPIGRKLSTLGYG